VSPESVEEDREKEFSIVTILDDGETAQVTRAQQAMLMLVKSELKPDSVKK
jgi:hypothetical protein